MPTYPKVPDSPESLEHLNDRGASHAFAVSRVRGPPSAAINPVRSHHPATPNAASVNIDARGETLLSLASRRGLPWLAESQ